MFLVNLTWFKALIKLRDSAFRSECKAIAAQAPEVTVTRSGSFDSCQELMGSMETTVRVAFGGMLMLLNRDASAGGFANVQWRTVTIINFYW